MEMVVMEFDVDENFLRHPTVWLSKKMVEKGGDVHWRALTEEEQVQFKGGMVKELGQVLTSKALKAVIGRELSRSRSSTNHEHALGFNMEKDPSRRSQTRRT